MAYKPTGRPVGRPLKDEARFLTFSFKADPQFMETVKEYAWRHRTSVGELIRDGLKWRLEDGDPLAYRYVRPPAQENMSIPVIPSQTPVAPEPMEPAGDASAACPGFDETKYHLGALCKRGHEWGTTGHSLRRNNSAGNCATCDTIRHREAKARAKGKAKGKALRP